MISLDDFIESTKSKDLQRDLSSNPEQLKSVIAPVDKSLKIVAGPGSGKTTVLVLHTLKLIYVDDVNPINIIATTFTIKAANELKSRLLGWGEIIRQYCLTKLHLSEEKKKQIEKINFNLITTGTLDSIAEQTLTDHRVPGNPPPVILDTAVALSLMNKKGYMGTGMFQSAVRNYFESEETAIFGEKPPSDKRSEFLINLNNRLKENLISVDRLSDYPCMQKCLRAYNGYLQDNLQMDFPTLEQKYYAFLTDKSDEIYYDSIKFVLVDEYQDTNKLQEKIYRSLFSFSIKNGGSCMVVGDDDQSLYRFRGSRSNLFIELESRMADTGVQFDLYFLSKNYRSTPNIVAFYNNFICMDGDFQRFRINKPEMLAERKEYVNYPILGMFRDSIEDLSRDLSKFILDIVKGNGFTFNDNDGKEWTIKRGATGSAADIVLLSGSPAEYNSGGKLRLPYIVNQYLSSRGIQVFNPRGQDLQNIRDVELLCGLTLLCIDPLNDYISSSYQKESGKIFVPRDAYSKIIEWRANAQNLIDQNPSVRGVGLREYVNHWQQMIPLNDVSWKDDVTLVDIMYNLLAWIPTMQNELEGLVYLQAVCRTADNSSFVNGFDGRIVFECEEVWDEFGKKKKICKRPMRSSVKNAIQDVFVPIASGLVDIDEDLMSDAPYDKLDIMSIHQAKGLEFPVTIVDVASDFSRNHFKQRFKRFPNSDDVDVTSATEDFLATLSPDIKIDRDPVDRCFDDMIRRYYVAFSRSQDVLLLVGLTPNRYDLKGKTIPNVGTGWTRDGRWVWGNGLNNLTHV